MPHSNLLKDVLTIGHSALEITNTKEFRSEILSKLENSFHASASVFSNWGNAGERADSWSEEGLYFSQWSSDYRELYSRNLRFQDPIFSWLESGGFIHNMSVTRLTNLVNLKAFEQSPLYQGLLRPNNCQYILSLALNFGSELMANVSLLRPTSSGDFRPEDMQAARLVAPMLTGAYKKLLLTEQLVVQADIISILMGAPDSGAEVILSDSLTTVFSSGKAQYLDKRLRDTGIEGIEDLLSRSKRTCKYLKHFKNGTGGSNRQLPPTLLDTLHLPDNLLIDIVLDCVETTKKLRYLRVSLHLRKNSKQDGHLKKDASLSLRETQVAQLVTAGYSCPQISKELCISLWTVKSHLKNIYSKMRVNNRVALAKLLD